MAIIENVSNQKTTAATVMSNDQYQSKLRSTTDLRLHDNGQWLYNKIGGTNGGGGEVELRDSFKRDTRELQKLFSKLNPMVEEFVPHSLVNNGLNYRCTLTILFYKTTIASQGMVNNIIGFTVYMGYSNVPFPAKPLAPPLILEARLTFEGADIQFFVVITVLSPIDVLS
ncbi:hypothetical protein PVK06_040315 [Gossypium arboreum]|uniref:Uncharacterized protein n=1 Tax=Gossypium arboreum TaxID=29729 RepID=A0ABR0N560_GOSAR|nr:hypothetical protein PVK06_040315 [Gossypium arboreum]